MESFEIWLENDLHNLFHSIRDNIFDPLPILVACDWLEEHGEAQLAQSIRKLVNYSTKQESDPKKIYKEIAYAKKEISEIQQNSPAHLARFSTETHAPNVIYDNKFYRWNAITNAFSVQDESYEGFSPPPRKLKPGEIIPDEVIKMFLIWRAWVWIDHGQLTHGVNGPEYDETPVIEKQIVGLLSRLVVRHEDNINDVLEGLRPFRIIRNFLNDVDILLSKVDKPVYYPELQEILQNLRDMVDENNFPDLAQLLDKNLAKVGGG